MAGPKPKLTAQGKPKLTAQQKAAQQLNKIVSRIKSIKHKCGPTQQWNGKFCEEDD